LLTHISSGNPYVRQASDAAGNYEVVEVRVRLAITVGNRFAALASLLRAVYCPVLRARLFRYNQSCASTRPADAERWPSG